MILFLSLNKRPNKRPCPTDLPNCWIRRVCYDRDKSWIIVPWMCGPWDVPSLPFCTVLRPWNVNFPAATVNRAWWNAPLSAFSIRTCPNKTSIPNNLGMTNPCLWNFSLLPCCNKIVTLDPIWCRFWNNCVLSFLNGWEGVSMPNFCLRRRILPLRKKPRVVDPPLPVWPVWMTMTFRPFIRAMCNPTQHLEDKMANRREVVLYERIEDDCGSVVIVFDKAVTCPDIPVHERKPCH
mmetsp:Transcript_35709/g.74311  ORF Transcript_35709/g.74311 Transcript_35709/m.74311 type:complete len:236 (-) Transcript_35709:105-812(-)